MLQPAMTGSNHPCDWCFYMSRCTGLYWTAHQEAHIRCVHITAALTRASQKCQVQVLRLLGPADLLQSLQPPHWRALAGGEEEEEEEGYKGCSSSYAAKGPQFLRDTAGKGRDRPSKANPQESLLRTLSVPSDLETTVMYTEGLCGR